jgi:hypothetical protein
LLCTKRRRDIVERSERDFERNSSIARGFRVSDPSRCRALTQAEPAFASLALLAVQTRPTAKGAKIAKGTRMPGLFLERKPARTRDHLPARYTGPPSEGSWTSWIHALCRDCHERREIPGCKKGKGGRSIPAPDYDITGSQLFPFKLGHELSQKLAESPPRWNEPGR